LLGKKSKECRHIFYWREGERNEERGGGREEEVEGRRGKERRRGRGETFYYIVSQFFLCPCFLSLPQLFLVSVSKQYVLTYRECSRERRRHRPHSASRPPPCSNSTQGRRYCHWSYRIIWSSSNRQPSCSNSAQGRRSLTVPPLEL